MNASKLAPAVGLIALVLTAEPSAAHFQLVHAGEANIRGGRAVDFTLVFAHPFAGDPVMEMGRPAGFYMVKQAGDQDPERVDLSDYLEPATFRGMTSEAAAYRAHIPGSLTRGLGDYTLVLEPTPYYEAEEDAYIQQFTKTLLNSGGVPGNWAEPIGLPAEIVPLDKPYAVWAPGIFRGVVMSDGAPVPFAEVEVEYMNYAIDQERFGWTGKPAIDAPHAVMENLSLFADANGTITVALPKAGWWGIGALGVGPVTEHKGKPLSQDAVIWVQAQSIPE